MLLSVLSALARHGVDPWQEAARLRAMPTEAAIREMACLVEALPQDSWALRLNADSTAARLIALLPKPTARPGTKPPADGQTRHAAVLHHRVLFIALIVIMLCGVIQFA